MTSEEHYEAFERTFISIGTFGAVILVAIFILPTLIAAGSIWEYHEVKDGIVLEFWGSNVPLWVFYVAATAAGAVVGLIIVFAYLLQAGFTAEACLGGPLLIAAGAVLGIGIFSACLWFFSLFETLWMPFALIPPLFIGGLPGAVITYIALLVLGGGRFFDDADAEETEDGEASETTTTDQSIDFGFLDSAGRCPNDQE